MNDRSPGITIVYLLLFASAVLGQTTPPNIVFIMVDDLGYADLGCYGSQAIATPRLDRLAEEGVRFTNAYSGCTVCAPARSTLLTGRHMGHTSVRGNTGGIALQAEDVTVAEVLKQRGYATGGFGKWGLGDLDTEGVPEKQGFDHFFGYYHQIHAHHYYPDYLIRNGQKVPLSGSPEETYSHTLIFHEMMDFIRQNKDHPFFCYAPWTLPHASYQIPSSDPAWQLYQGKPWERKAKVIAAMTSMIDRHIGQVLDLLQELKIDQNTIVFFCSDNGTAERCEGVLDSSGSLRGRKRDLYEGGLRVPLIVHWPGHIKAGQISDLPCYFPDVLPTLAQLAGAQAFVPKEMDGLSITPTLLSQGTQPTHDCLYWEWPFYNWNTKRYEPEGLMQAVRRGHWKMLRHRSTASWELYDLSIDVGESNDVALQHPDIIHELTTWIENNRTDPRPQIEPKMAPGRQFR